MKRLLLVLLLAACGTPERQPATWDVDLTTTRFNELAAGALNGAMTDDACAEVCGVAREFARGCSLEATPAGRPFMLCVDSTPAELP